MWQDEMVPMVRAVIGDTDTYTDERLETAICIAAKFVSAQYFKTYTVTNSSITPDPTNPLNTWFVNLTVLKTACMIGNAEARVSAGQGIAIKDGPSSLDLKGISQYKATSAKTFCQMYDDAAYAYLNNGGVDGSAYQAVMSPFDYGSLYGRAVHPYTRHT